MTKAANNSKALQLWQEAENQPAYHPELVSEDDNPYRRLNLSDVVQVEITHVFDCEFEVVND